MSQIVKPESPVSLLILAAVVMALFTLFTTFEPSFQQIKINATEIRSNSSDIDSVKEIQKDYLDHMISVSKSLSRIEGRLDATVTQGRLGPR